MMLLLILLLAAKSYQIVRWRVQASVLIFPDLNTGNNTYKAVPRETGA
jgi:phosphotransacetylase